MKKLFSVSLCLAFVATAFAETPSNTDCLHKLNYAFTVVNSYYVDSVDRARVTDEAIQGMLSSLDPHSSYMNKEKAAEAREPLQGSFEGIGVSFNMVEDTLLVVQAIVNGPSEKVGIIAGDKIIAVNDTAIAGVKMSQNDIMKRLRGKKGTTVQVTVLRGGQRIPFTIVRDKIPISSVDTYYMVTSNIGYIKISRFASTTYQEMTDAIKILKRKGMNRLIVDLQGNGGGYMQSAVDMADEFLNADNIIVYTKGDKQRTQVFAAKSHSKLFSREKLVVLVDEYSASASEIFSGAIQDWDRGAIVGRRTFGKGLVQRPFTLPDGSEIRLTIARYYTPAGRCIQRPYESGKEDYEREFAKRYEHGEMVSADSISFPDSLRYTTRIAKRTVFGGGGIMPDVFVPADTTRLDSLSRVIFHGNYHNKTVVAYLEKHRDALRRTFRTIDDFESSFLVDEEMYAILQTKLEADSVRFTPEQLAAANEYATPFLKAFLARYLWGLEGYFRIYNKTNPIFLKGVELLTDDKQYYSIFKVK
ncbi:MAG: S41 family peptidase [Paludibacteraceae bacterium]|nr:S41 family peptidase [Paludibacteraceae bacterium]